MKHINQDKMEGTVTISLKEYLKLKDTNDEIFKAFSDSKILSRVWNPIIGYTIEVVNEPEHIKMLIDVIERHQKTISELEIKNHNLEVELFKIKCKKGFLRW